MLSWQDRIRVARDVAEGLLYLHMSQVISPNILRSSNRHLYRHRLVHMLERISHIDRTLHEKPTRHPPAAISGHMADLAARLHRRRDPSPHIRTEYVTVTLACH
eukprot:1187051-Prorocentrum_minimum.AAC.2